MGHSIIGPKWKMPCFPPKLTFLRVFIYQWLRRPSSSYQADMSEAPRPVKGRFHIATQHLRVLSPEEATMREIGCLDPCILCGCMMHEGVERRYKQCQYIAWLIRRCCAPTPFVYREILYRASVERKAHRDALSCIKEGEAITACPCCLNPPEWNGGNEEIEICNKGSRVPFCIACINWVRRLSNYANKPAPGPGDVGSKRKRGGKVSFFSSQIIICGAHF